MKRNLIDMLVLRNIIANEHLRHTLKKLIPRLYSTASIPCEEIRIPVPWGHIAGKWWGPQEKRPVLVLHGWQDNCGSYDRLIPQLPTELGYLAIDFPGHGYSSKYPQGMFYHIVNGVLLISRLMEYFQWQQVSLLGHSMGAIISYMFGMFRPELVDFAVCIDGFHPPVNKKGMERSVRTINEFIKYDRMNTISISSVDESPAYTMEEMELKLHLGNRKSIELPNCKYILQRNIAPSKKHPGKFCFTRDLRLKCGALISTNADELVETAKRITFPLFISKFEHSPFFKDKEHFNRIFENLKANSPDCQYFDLPGKHHDHLNSPSVLKEIVSSFILKHNTRDRNVGGIQDGMLSVGQCEKLST